MKKTLLMVMAVLSCILAPSYQVWATPSTQVWNPSTDIQARGSLHLGIDNYYSVADNEANPYASPTYIGLTYGIINGLEAGFDLAEPSADPLFLNLKYGIPEKGAVPAFAIGAFNVGTKSEVTDYNIIYGLAAKTFGSLGRVTAGYYSGSDRLLVDENGEKANTGFIAAWDKALSEKVWASVDYASGKNVYGSLSAGFSYAFSKNTSVLFGYVMFNNGKLNKNDQFTTQLDINF